ncbi:MAG: hypothetical protein HOV80_15530, partial [Polyangiaceae bacterium]|nr:hypothetical protein [Polyangiaceae bacterium]
MTEASEIALREGIARAADQVRGNDFWVNLRPFILRVGPESPESLSDLVAEGIPEVLGWEPQDEVIFAAMCNSDEDHRL